MVAMQESARKELPPMHLERLQREIRGLNQREQDYFERARQADMILIVGGCDDSRQNVPQGELDIEFEGRMQHVVMDFVPTIGGGVSREVMPAVVQRFIDEGIDPSRIVVAVTQHGNSDEVNSALEGDASENPTCGLRGVLKKIEAGEHVHLQHDLMHHAGDANRSSSIIANGEFVYTETQQVLRGLGVRVVGGFFDHEGDDQNGKSLELTQGVNEHISISLPDQAAWHEGHQDPRALVVSVGRRAAATPDGVILPETVGMGANNDFNSAAVDASSFVDAVAEQFYPLHYTHTDNSNFKTTGLMVFQCDGDAEVQMVRSWLNSDTFTHDYASHVERLPDKGVYIANLSKETVEFISTAK